MIELVVRDKDQGVAFWQDVATFKKHLAQVLDISPSQLQLKQVKFLSHDFVLRVEPPIYTNKGILVLDEEICEILHEFVFAYPTFTPSMVLRIGQDLLKGLFATYTPDERA